MYILAKTQFRLGILINHADAFGSTLLGPCDAPVLSALSYDVLHASYKAIT